MIGLNSGKAINDEVSISIVGSGARKSISEFIANGGEITVNLDSYCIYCSGTGYLKQKEMVGVIGGNSFSQLSKHTVRCPHCN